MQTIINAINKNYKKPLQKQLSETHYKPLRKQLSETIKTIITKLFQNNTNHYTKNN